MSVTNTHRTSQNMSFSYDAMCNPLVYGSLNDGWNMTCIRD